MGFRYTEGINNEKPAENLTALSNFLGLLSGTSYLGWFNFRKSSTESLFYRGVIMDGMVWL